MDFVVLTVNVEIDGNCHLFTGVLHDFTTNSEGNLGRVVLSYAARRPYSGPESKIPRGHPLGDGWVEIPGEYLVINLDPLATINVDYFYIDPPPGEEATATPGEHSEDAQVEVSA